MPKPRARKAMFSLAPVEFRNSPIEGRGVFARKRFSPGDVVVPYAPRQRKLDLADPEAIAAAAGKLTLLSDRRFVILPDTSVPGGWLANHGCNPNAVLYSSGEGRIECIRGIVPGEEITIFYGWVTRNEPGRDPCRCGHGSCRGFINFDVSDDDARAYGSDDARGVALRERIAEYGAFLGAIGQEHVLGTIERTLAEMRAHVAVGQSV